MWHQIKQVAKSRRLNEADMVEFAQKPEISRKYSIIIEEDSKRISNWHVDEFVEQFGKEAFYHP